MASRLRLADLRAGLSVVADMGYGLPQGHALRSSLIGVGLARSLGLAESEVAETLYTSMLVHVGCVGFSHEMAAAFGDELAANRAGARTNFSGPRDIFATLIPYSTLGMRPAAAVRTASFIVTNGRSLGRRYDTTVCEVARQTARRMGLADGVQRALYQIKEVWNGGGAPRGLKGEEIAMPARIARTAAEASLFDQIGGAELVVSALKRRAGGMLDPAVVEELLVRSSHILHEAAAADPRELILSIEPHPAIWVDVAELPRLASVFGDLADLKTPFTHGHSRGVARLAKAAAERLGMNPEQRPHRAALEASYAAEELSRAARDGELDADAVAAVIEAAGLDAAPRRDLRPAGLSDREVEVLRLVSRACTNREIAEQLHISRRTAEHRVQHIYTKLGVSSRSALALFAMEHDLLPARRPA